MLLLAAVILLFRPDFFMDQLAPEYRDAKPAEVYNIARDTEGGGRVVVVIKGSTIEGRDIVKTVALQLGDKGPEGRKRLVDAGLQLVVLGGNTQVGQAKFGSRAAKSGFESGWDVTAIKVPTDRPSAHWFYLPAFALMLLVWLSQGQRMRQLVPHTA